jgi:hypothetical protein
VLGECAAELARLDKAPIAVEAVERIDALFAIEREINGLTPSQRLAVSTGQAGGTRSRGWRGVQDKGGGFSIKGQQTGACWRASMALEAGRTLKWERPSRAPPDRKLT